jgi:hypothetical protein
VVEEAARTGTMLEINGNPNRRDLSEHHARLAREAGATIVLNTDAHGIDTLGNMAYAVATARRAWLTPPTSPTRGVGRVQEAAVALSARAGGRCAGPGVRTSSIGEGRSWGHVELDAVAVLDAEHGGLAGAQARATRRA